MQKNGKVVPGWDREIENARNKSLLWHFIWKQSEKPVSGHIYSIMKKCRSPYHYFLRLLKKERKKKNKDCNFKKGIK